MAFLRELSPRRAVAWVAGAIYGERYLTASMQRRIVEDDADGVDGLSRQDRAPSLVEYSWQYRGRPGRVAVECDGDFLPPREGSHEQFIVEHYWGYTALRGGATKEYRVAHPPWRVAAATSAQFEGDVAALYGEPFVAPLSAPQASAFLADGSAVRVYRGKTVQA